MTFGMNEGLLSIARNTQRGGYTRPSPRRAAARAFVRNIGVAITLLAAAGTRAGPSNLAPTGSAKSTARKWYGWQILLTDAVAAGSFAAAWVKKDWDWFGAGMAMFVLGGPTVHAFHEPNNIRASAQLRLETLAGGATLAGGFREAADLSVVPCLWIIAGATAVGSAIDIIGASHEVSITSITPQVTWSQRSPALIMTTSLTF